MKEKKEKRGSIKSEMYKMFGTMKIGDTVIVREPFTTRKQGTDLRSYIVSYANTYYVEFEDFKVKTKVVDGAVHVTRIQFGENVIN